MYAFTMSLSRETTFEIRRKIGDALVLSAIACQVSIVY